MVAGIGSCSCNHLVIIKRDPESLGKSSSYLVSAASELSVYCYYHLMIQHFISSRYSAGFRFSCCSLMLFYHFGSRSGKGLHIPGLCEDRSGIIVSSASASVERLCVLLDELSALHLAG